MTEPQFSPYFPNLASFAKWPRDKRLYLIAAPRQFFGTKPEQNSPITTHVHKYQPQHLRLFQLIIAFAQYSATRNRIN